MIAFLQRPMLRRLYAVVWLVFMTVTLLESSSKPIVGSAVLFRIDPLLTAAHAAAFSVLLVLLWCALYPVRHALTAALIFCCVYGAATELLQTLVPDRGASLSDFAVDCAASGLAALLVYYRASLPIHRLIPSVLKWIVPSRSVR